MATVASISSSSKGKSSAAVGLLEKEGRTDHGHVGIEMLPSSASQSYAAAAAEKDVGARRDGRRKAEAKEPGNGEAALIRACISRSTEEVLQLLAEDGPPSQLGQARFIMSAARVRNGPRPSVSATVRLLIIPFAIWIALICFAVGIMYQPLSPSPLFIYASVVYCIFVIRPTMKQWQMHRVAMNPLRAAVASGNEDKVRAILGHGADAADGPAIMIAACRGQNRTLELLLDAGGDLDSSDDGVFTTAAVVSIFCCVCSGWTCRKFPASLLRTIFRTSLFVLIPLAALTYHEVKRREPTCAAVLWEGSAFNGTRWDIRDGLYNVDGSGELGEIGSISVTNACMLVMHKGDNLQGDEFSPLYPGEYTRSKLQGRGIPGREIKSLKLWPEGDFVSNMGCSATLWDGNLVGARSVIGVGEHRSADLQKGVGDGKTSSFEVTRGCKLVLSGEGWESKEILGGVYTVDELPNVGVVDNAADFAQLNLVFTNAY